MINSEFRGREGGRGTYVVRWGGRATGRKIVGIVAFLFWSQGRVNSLVCTLISLWFHYCSMAANACPTPTRQLPSPSNAPNTIAKCAFVCGHERQKKENLHFLEISYCICIWIATGTISVYFSGCQCVCLFVCLCVTGVKERQVLFTFKLPYLKKRYSLQCQNVLKAEL